MYELANIDELREQFPVTQQRIYMDHANWSPLPSSVRAAVDEFMQRRQYAASTKNEWNEKVVQVKGKVATLMNCSRNEIAFTKNTTEGISIAANGIGLRAGDNVLITDAEHAANLYPWLNLTKEGVELRILEARGRDAKVSDFERLIDPHTRAIAIDHVENWYGFRRDICRLGRFCRSHGLLFIVNATQSCGTMPIDVKENHIDILSFSCFKWLLSPYGMGCFYCDERLIERIVPREVGDRSGTISSRESDAKLILAADATRFESGNLNYPGVYGLGAALDMIADIGVERIQKKIVWITGVLTKGLSDLGLKIISPLKDEFRSAIVSFSVDDPNDIVARLLEKGIYVNVRGGMIRVSPHFYNTEQEMRVFIETLAEFV